MEVSELEAKAKDLRKQVLEMCIRAKTGHVTSCFSCVEILTTLYYGGVLKKDDRFVLSKGQASPLLYVMLADLHYFSKNRLEGFCQADDFFGVHLQHSVPGVETTAGSLGYGLGIAAGMALAKKQSHEPGTIYTLLGDGECYEGSIWEAMLFISHNDLNVVAIVDRNQMSAIDFTEHALKLEPFGDKWQAAGWEVRGIGGHSFPKLLSVFDNRTSSGPLMVLANTIKGKGIRFMENQILWHGRAPVTKEEITQARGELEGIYKKKELV